MDSGNQENNTSATAGSMDTMEFDQIGANSTYDPAGYATSGTSGNSAANSDPIKSALQDTVQQVQSTVGQVAGQAQDTAGTVMDQVKSTATTKLEDQKKKAAENVANMAKAIQEAGSNMDVSSPIADYAEKAARQLEGFSTYLQEHDLGSMLTDVEHFARRQPTLFVGGGLLLGMLGARFLKSSSSGAQKATQASEPAGWDGASAYGSTSPGYGTEA
jgi:uncharacterized protein YjbJ (UPF0337 family)